jgi:hypothetical protein
MPRETFATTEPQLSPSIGLRSNLGEDLEVWAYGNRVVVEIADGHDCINAHLTIAQAEQHIKHVEAQIAAAVRLGGHHLRLVTP